ncbi:MAG TPA: hypothetical protein VFT71_00115, partial [Candidatus Nitrosocosmicus sp.]|nr:hypothetical protein [Candidatus Nitrosocosmicus sp.]
SILNTEISEIAPITYNVKLLDNNASEILFDNNFLVLGNDLQIELISNANANKTTIRYSPDIADPITDHTMLQALARFKGKNLV